MTPSSRWPVLLRSGLLLLLLLLMLLAVAGCRVGVDVVVDVGRDGSGALTLGMRADAEALERGRAAGADPLEPLVQAGERLRDQGWSLDDRVDDQDTREVRLGTRFADPGELDVLVGDLVESLAGPEGRPLEALSLTLSEDRVRIEGSAALQPTDVVADYGLSPEELVDLLRERDVVDYRIRVAMPGEVLEHNGTLVGDTALEWRILPGERVDILVEGVRPTGPDWLLVGFGTAIVVNVLLLAALLVRRRRSRRRSRGPATRSQRSARSDGSRGHPSGRLPASRRASRVTN
jgi:hypothetical protein